MLGRPASLVAVSEATTDRKRVAVIGGGAIGGYVAAMAADAGHEVTVCVRTPFEQLIVEDASGTRTVPVTVVDDPGKITGAFGWVFLAVKVQDTAGTAAWLDALAGPDTVVVVVQNGLRHRERVLPFVADGVEILPAIAAFAIEPLGPGHVRHVNATDLRVPRNAAGEALARLLAGTAVDVQLMDDFATAAWGKLIGNLIGNPITALTERRAAVLHEPFLQETIQRLLHEAHAVSVADGAHLSMDEVQERFAFLLTLTPDTGSSMYYDRMSGRRLEHEALTGAVVALGHEHGVPVPTHEVLLALLRGLDTEPRGSGR